MRGRTEHAEEQAARRGAGRDDSGREPVPERARVALSLQRSAGNRAVSALLVQRKNGKKGGGTKAEREAADKQRRKQQQQQREASSAAAMNERIEAGRGRREAAAAESVRQAERSRQKAAKVAEIATTWRADINAAVAQVQALRREKRDAGWTEDRIAGINAGNNPGAAPIPGGTGNPITFTVPRNDFAITKADVSTTIVGFDSSDSGLFKFRMADGIFIHGQ